ncbi:hypothetical protein PHET_07414 [Paragonimus heterotremus]|uniref:Uncharacterized protein n=1 Tax=Paragonimus heterotremus TaxID=100268 RepID=A0A8J4SIK9_9TREM|nr:hypothetical protein PHET_07414 [Paragonimus heterotremus]
MLRDFNRLAYMFYEKCLKTSSVPAEELLAVERKITESLNFRKPSVFSFRFNQRPISAKRGPSTSDRGRTLQGTEQQSISVVNLQDRVSLPPVNERTNRLSRQGSTQSGETETQSIN